MRALLLLAALGVVGCTLIDQNTFNPHARDAPVVAPAPVPPAALQGPLPLLRIAPGTLPAAYLPMLRDQVRAARLRKPDVVFDVVEMVAPNTPTDATGSAGVGAAGAQVARGIVDQGIPPARVRLVARPDAGAVPQEVRVFVR